MQRIVVGVSDRDSSGAALRWAQRAAAAHRATLEILTVYQREGRRSTPDSSDAAMAQQNAVVAAELPFVASDLLVRREAVPGDPVEVLCGRAMGAIMLVVGRQRHRLRWLHRSTSAACVDAASCPVVVVRGDLDPEAVDALRAP